MSAICSVCKKKDQKYIPIEWCTECETALCSTCSQKHKQDTTSEDHDTLSYNDYLQLPPFIKNLNQTCPDHKEKYLYLCREHDQLICNKCLKTEHKKCEETPVLKDIVRNVKTSHAFEDVTNEMKEKTVIIHNCIKELQNNLNEIQKQRKEMARSVEKTMERIFAELKKLKQDMLSDIDATVKTTEKELIATMQKLQTMTKEMEEIIEQKQSITLHATNLQTYFGIKKMEKLEEETTRSLNELSHKGALDNINIVLDQTKSVEMLLMKVKLFGEMKVIKRTMDLSVETSKLQEAQNLTYNLPQQLRLQQTVNLGPGCHDGCCTLPNGLVVVTDSENKLLNLIYPDRTMRSIVKFEEKPYGVTVVDDNRVAVSHDRTISMIGVSTEKVTRSWNTENEVAGISYRNGHIILCSAYTGLKRLDIDTGAIDDVINDEDVSCYSQVVTGSDRICYTCPAENTVTVLNLQHDVIFKYNDIDTLKFPIGVTVDSYNNVYAAGLWSHNVLVISPDGQKVNQLLKQEDGLWGPTGIYYDSHTKQLTVITDSLTEPSLRTYSLG